MIYIIGIIEIILYLIMLIIDIKNKEKTDYRINCIVFEIVIIIIIIMRLIDYKLLENTDNYIQNIETKLNIYEQSYEEKTVEDSLRQNRREWK